jgi:hypothetical protein
MTTTAPAEGLDTPTGDAPDPHGAPTRPAPTGGGQSTVTVTRPTGGVAYHWSLQAWIDMWMSKRMLVDRGGMLVSHTFVPMLRVLSADPAQVERDYTVVRARRERRRPWDSPRERWRKAYGDFVREMEWALLELRGYFPREQYEEIVLGTLETLSRLDSQKEIDALNGLVTKVRKVRDERAAQRAAGIEPTDPTEVQGLKGALQRLADPTRFSAFLVGDAEVTEIDFDSGTATMEVPNCAWHTCPAPDSLPRPGVLPEEGCLLVCKGLFERLFDGGDGLSMRFDPHLPETSCTISMRM